FDEEFFIYAEDDDFCLRMRRDGWRIRYTPHASGIHLEHQSTDKLGSISEPVGKANAIFARKWGSYLDHNINRVPGNFDYAGGAIGKHSMIAESEQGRSPVMNQMG